MLHGSQNAGITVPGQNSRLLHLGLYLAELAPWASGKGVYWRARWMVVLCLHISVLRTYWKGQEFTHGLACGNLPCGITLWEQNKYKSVWSFLSGKKEWACLHFCISVFFLPLSPPRSFEFVRQFYMRFDEEVESSVTMKFLQIHEI